MHFNDIHEFDPQHRDNSEVQSVVRDETPTFRSLFSINKTFKDP